jgi:dTDP-4-dehydrorhamnose reductase
MKSDFFFKKSNYFIPDFIINTVALTDVDLCEKNPELAFETNVNYINFLANFCAKNHSKLVHISTDHLSDGLTPCIKENHELYPINQYGKTKLLAEKLIKSKISNSIILRTNFFGWGPKYRQSFSDRIIDSIKSNKEIYLFEDAFFSPVSIRRLCKTILLLLNKKKKGIFNICSNDRISKYNFGLKICDYFNLKKDLVVPCSIEDAKDLVLRPKDTSLNNKKITNGIGFDCGYVSNNINDLIYDLNDGIKDQLIKL